MEPDPSPSSAASSPPPLTGVRRTLRVRSRLPFVILGLLLVNQIFNPARIWVGVIFGLAALLLLCYLWARLLRDGLDAQRVQRGAWVLAGDALHERFTVENRSGMPALWVEVLDHSDLPGYQPDWVAFLDAYGQQSYRTAGRCQRRGVFTLGPWALRTGDPIGIFEVFVEYLDSRSILVYPRAMALPDLRLPRGVAPGAARTQRRSNQPTTTVATVRPYTPGDPLRAIHWRQTARHDQLMVKQFDLEPSGDLWIALDLDAAGHAGEGAESTLEYAVTLTASLAAQMLAENRRVGLAAPGHLIPPHGGQLQLWRILEALALAGPAAGYPMDRVLRDLRQGGHSGRGRTIVAVTPAVGPAWPGELLYLAGQGNAPAALLLDAASFLPDDDPQRPARAQSLAGLRSLLAEHAIPSHLIDRSFDFRPLVQITRTRRELRTLSAFGRVIAVDVEEVL